LSFDLLRKAISDQMVNNWTATALNRIAHGDNRTGLNANVSPWVRLSYQTYSNKNAELGNTFQRIRGVIMVQIFTPSNTGEKTASVIADDVMTVFQNKDFGSVTTYAVKITKIGERGDEFQLNAEVDFKYDIFS
tara:strand:- start:333 stop:734 length:402 start_codon:yes stop_codon:yes gene_type:complete